MRVFGQAWPITNKQQLSAAIARVGGCRGSVAHSHERAKEIRRHIIERAHAIGRPELLPHNWRSDGSFDAYTHDPLDLSWMRAESWKNLGRIARPVAH